MKSLTLCVGNPSAVDGQVVTSLDEAGVDVSLASLPADEIPDSVDPFHHFAAPSAEDRHLVPVRNDRERRALPRGTQAQGGTTGRRTAQRALPLSPQRLRGSPRRSVRQEALNRRSQGLSCGLGST